jgi:hypothetical protein
MTEPSRSALVPKHQAHQSHVEGLCPCSLALGWNAG